MWFAVIILSILFTAPVRADLHNPNNSADYLILTSEDVLSTYAWIDSLLDYRTDQGRVAMAVTVEEIWSEFSPAGSDTAIREFLRYALDQWQAPRLKDVFIIGHTDIVPSHVMFGILDSSEYFSDFFYVQGDSALDLEPRFRLGRLPWSPEMPDELPSFFAKIQTYELSSAEECGAAVHAIAAAYDSTLLWDFEPSCEGVITRMPGTLSIERDYAGRAANDPYFGDANEIRENLNGGATFTFFFGHVGRDRWALPEPFLSSEWESLTNSECMTILFGYQNHSLGDDGTKESLSSSAVLNPDGGAIAVFGNSSIGWAVAGHNFGFAIGSHAYAAGIVSLGDLWGSVTSEYGADVWGTNSSAYQTLMSNVLLGDPATILPGRSTSAQPITAPVIPSEIRIVGNYPNPFNPSTTINFSLTRAGAASLTVFDITGRTVGTILTDNLSAGEHSVMWSPTGLASGVYLVRLESAGRFATHRVTLLK
ncbi:MAG: T9SS type A sorting domain-containing protein [Calditrichaeota bacterium]|nr:T9SS type A sorting domain-containing protein [Calditrichota bacterium]